MRLLAVVIGILVDLYIKKPFTKSFDFFLRVWRALQPRLGQGFFSEGWGLLLLLLLPVFCVVGGLFLFIHYTIVGFILSVLLLWYCLGFADVQLDEETGAVPPDVFWQAHEKIFGVIFWFMLLGPTGALMYRLISVVTTAPSDLLSEKTAQAANTLHSLLAFLPARLTGLSYILVGNFSPGFSHWLKSFTALGGSKDLLLLSGSEAIPVGAAAGDSSTTASSDNVPATKSSYPALIKRALVVWVVALTLFTVSFWLNPVVTRHTNPSLESLTAGLIEPMLNAIRTF